MTRTPFGGGDDDFIFFSINVDPDPAPVTVVIQFQNRVKVWKTRTKEENGQTSEIPSGAQFDPEHIPAPLYIEGQCGSQNLRDVSLKATLKYGQNEICSDMVKITVFEVILTGLFNGEQEDDCEVRLTSFKASSDVRGKISWDDKDGDGVPEGAGDYDSNCEYFHKCMECQGTVKPQGLTGEVVFDFVRHRCRRMWKKFGDGDWGPPFVDDTPWTWDESVPDNDEDTTPSADNHIYHIDGPGFRSKDRALGDYFAYVGDFRECVRVSIMGDMHQCSDFYKWHHQMYLKPKNETELTRAAAGLQKLGGGWIAIPDKPVAMP